MKKAILILFCFLILSSCGTVGPIDLGARLGVFFGVVLVMGILEDLFKKAPQSIKDKYKIKIREKAIERIL